MLNANPFVLKTYEEEQIEIFNQYISAREKQEFLEYIDNFKEEDVEYCSDDEDSDGQIF